MKYILVIGIIKKYFILTILVFMLFGFFFNVADDKNGNQLQTL